MPVNTKILVTGGAGYIGSETAKQLSDAGLEPVVYDNLSTGYEEFVRWGPLVKGNLLDGELLRETIRRHRPQAIVHFAAASLVGESVQRPEFYYHNNIGGTLSLLEAMRDTGVNNIVVSSSCAVYGIPVRVPITEDFPLNPINPYGTTKAIMEALCRDFEVAHEIRWVALRYFNACGANPESGVGERHIPETHLIPRVLMALDDEIECLDIFGDDYATGDGTCERDYIHITDLAQAHVGAVRHLMEGKNSIALNLGAGIGCSVRQIIAAAKSVTGRDIPHRVVARRPGDPPRLLADSGKARQKLGWIPEHSGLPEIIETAWEWHKKDKKQRLGYGKNWADHNS
jgi:UDP-arabinose 4-epimerase